MKVKLIIIVHAFILTSCNKNEVYDEFKRDFSDNRWESKDVKSFEFENMKSEEVCELKLHFGHISGFQFKEVPLEVEISTPAGKTETLPVVMKLIDESGKDIGDCTGDVCDVFQSIKTFEKLEKGKYKITIKSKFEGPYLPNVLGVGIVVEKQK
jgi:gliding motility-associated lipoprotein GldH